MKPASPIVAGLERFEVVYAEAQEEFTPLPALIGRAPTYVVISRWMPTDTERQQIADGADIYVIQSTYGRTLQPIALGIGGVEQDSNAFMQSFGIGDVILDKNIKDVLDSLQP